MSVVPPTGVLVASAIQSAPWTTPAPPRCSPRQGEEGWRAYLRMGLPF